MLEQLPVDFARTSGAIITGTGETVRIEGDLGGYEINDGTFTGTATLQGSVVGKGQWTDIANITDSQGAIPDHYTWVRISCTVKGTGDITSVFVSSRR